MNRDMEEGGCVNTPGQAGRNELRPYKILVGAEGGDGSTVGATKNKNGRLAEAHRPFHIFVKWN